MINKVVLVGRLTKDPEIRHTGGADSLAVAKWSIAVDRRYKKEGGQEADFFDCTAFGKLADHMEKYWRKGMKIALSGRLEQSQWTDRDGKKRSSVGVTVEEVEFCERKDAAAETAKASDFLPADKDEDLPFSF